jgi:hypothetical protein
MANKDLDLEFRAGFFFESNGGEETSPPLFDIFLERSQSFGQFS